MKAFLDCRFCRQATGPRALGSSLGCIDIYERAATGAIFSQIKERAATHTGAPADALFVRGVDTGRLLATIDTEMRKNGPVPSGCGANPGSPATAFRRWGGNWAILRYRPRPWSRQSLRPPPRLAQFSLATLPTRICRYTLDPGRNLPLIVSLRCPPAVKVSRLPGGLRSPPRPGAPEPRQRSWCRSPAASRIPAR